MYKAIFYLILILLALFPWWIADEKKNKYFEVIKLGSIITAVLAVASNYMNMRDLEKITLIIWFVIMVMTFIYNGSATFIIKDEDD